MSRISLKEINRLAIPAIFAGISEPLISLGDTAVLGRLPDSEIALSAIGNATAFYLTIVWVLAQVKSAISALVSRFLGQDELDEVQTLVPQAILLMIGLGTLLYVSTAPFAEPIMELYQTKGKALEYASDYYRIRAIGFPLILAAFTIFGVFRGLQNTLWAMQISLIGAALNVVLDIALVHGIKGVIPAMHVEGAAIASLVAQSWTFAGALFFLFKKTSFRLKPGRQINPHLPILLKIAGNLFLRTIILNFTTFMASRTATGFGNAYNAAHNMAYQVWLFSAFFIDGYSNAANAISGKLLGKGDYVHMKQMLRDVLKFNILIATGLALLAGLAYFQIGHWLTNDETTVSLFEHTLWVTLLILPINAVAFTLDGVFKGLGEAGFLRNVLFWATLCGFLPVLLVSTEVFDLQLWGIWFALMAWIVVRSLLPWLQFQRLVNRKINEGDR